MSPFEYLLAFAAVVLGLAITDLAVSLNRLLNAGRRVRWGLVTPLAAGMVFLKIATQWWTWYGAQFLAQSISFEMFVGVMIGAVLLFLLAAATLPDAPHGDGAVDLPAHYASVRRRFWLLFAAHWVIMNGVAIWAEMQLQGARLDLLRPAYLIPFGALALAFVPIRWVHAMSLAGLIVLYLAQFQGQQLAMR